MLGYQGQRQGHRAWSELRDRLESCGCLQVRLRASSGIARVLRSGLHQLEDSSRTNSSSITATCRA